MVNIEELTENEIYLLKLAFRLANKVVEMQHRDPCYGLDMRDDLFNLKEKLGIYDLIEGY